MILDRSASGQLYSPKFRRPRIVDARARREPWRTSIIAVTAAASAGIEFGHGNIDPLAA
jgi:hypothetical protein